MKIALASDIHLEFGDLDLTNDENAEVLILSGDICTAKMFNGNPCPPRSALHGKIAQTPSLILTVHGQLASMGVCAVKNRYGPADANGATPVWLAYDPASMQIKDLVAP